MSFVNLKKTKLYKYRVPVATGLAVTVAGFGAAYTYTTVVKTATALREGTLMTAGIWGYFFPSLRRLEAEAAAKREREAQDLAAREERDMEEERERQQGLLAAYEEAQRERAELAERNRLLQARIDEAARIHAAELAEQERLRLEEEEEAREIEAAQIREREAALQAAEEAARRARAANAAAARVAEEAERQQLDSWRREFEASWEADKLVREHRGVRFIPYDAEHHSSVREVALRHVETESIVTVARYMCLDPSEPYALTNPPEFVYANANSKLWRPLVDRCALKLAKEEGIAASFLATLKPEVVRAPKGDVEQWIISAEEAAAGKVWPIIEKVEEKPAPQLKTKVAEKQKQPKTSTVLKEKRQPEAGPSRSYKFGEIMQRNLINASISSFVEPTSAELADTTKWMPLNEDIGPTMVRIWWRRETQRMGHPTRKAPNGEPYLTPAQQLYRDRAADFFRGTGVIPTAFLQSEFTEAEALAIEKARRWALNKASFTALGERKKNKGKERKQAEPRLASNNPFRSAIDKGKAKATCDATILDSHGSDCGCPECDDDSHLVTLPMSKEPPALASWFQETEDAYPMMTTNPLPTLPRPRSPIGDLQVDWEGAAAREAELRSLGLLTVTVNGIDNDKGKKPMKLQKAGDFGRSSAV